MLAMTNPYKRHCEERSNLFSTMYLDGFAKHQGPEVYSSGTSSRNDVLLYQLANLPAIFYLVRNTYMAKGGSVYMMCSLNDSTIYTGVCSDLVARVLQHKEKTDPNSFTATYNCIKLVYYCFYETIEAAIEEEKRIKGGSRKQK